MENNKKNNYNKSYEKQNGNNRQQERDITKQMQEIDKKLKQKQDEINKELDRKQEEFNIKIEQSKIEIIKSLNNDIDDQIKTSISKKLREEEKKIIGNKNRKIINGAGKKPRFLPEHPICAHLRLGEGEVPQFYICVPLKIAARGARSP